MSGCKRKRRLVATRIQRAHKRPRTQSSLSSSEVLPQNSVLHCGMPSNGQHNSSGTCEQQRGHPLPSSRRTYSRTLAVVPKTINSDKCPAHTRKVQHNCRQGVKAIFRYKGMANRPPDNQAFPEGLQHRSVCLAPDCTSSQIRQLETRPQCHLHRCHDTRLSSTERLRFPTFLSDPSSSEEGIPGQGRPCPSRSSMAGTTLVACSPEPTDKTSSGNPKLQTPTQGPSISSDSTSNGPKTPPSHLSHIREHHQTEGFSQDITKLLLSATRPNAHKTYQSAWGLWSCWCSTRKVNPVSASLNEILLFLSDRFNNGFAYRSVNVARSAISSCHPKIDGYLVGQHLLVVQLLKGMLTVKPDVLFRATLLTSAAMLVF